MSEGDGPQLSDKRINWDVIFWTASILTLGFYLIAVPVGLYRTCSTPEPLQQIIPGHIFISGQQTEQQGAAPTSDRRKLPLEQKVIPTHRTINETAQATYYPERQPEHVWWKSAICDAHLSDYLIGLFTLVLAISTIGLWRQTERLAEGADDQFNNMVRSINATLAVANRTREVAEAMDDAASAMRRLTGQTERLANDAKDSAERQLRAYIHVGAAELIAANSEGVVLDPPQAIRSGFKITTHLTIVNRGQTPANDVRIYGRLKCVTWPITADKLPILPYDSEHISNSCLGPQDVSHKYEITDDVLSVIDERQLQSGELAVVVYGEIKYVDAFNHEHVTGYRYFSGGPVGIRGMMLVSHPEGNYAK